MREDLEQRKLKTSLTEDELKELGTLFYKVIEKMMPGGERARSWIHLFKKIDDDNSDLIRFDELANMVQVELRKETDLVDAKLRQLWCTLDKDASDTVTREEFGKFMKLAGPDDSVDGSAAERTNALREEHLAEAAAKEAEEAAMVGYNSMKTAEVRKALKENGMGDLEQAELLDLSKTFNQQLEKAHPGNGYFTLFSMTDDDGSGKLFFDELVKVCRLVTRDGGLGLSAGDLPDAKLKQLWCTLDVDDSNSMTVEEFGNFMNLGVHRAAQGEQHASRVNEKLEKLKEQEAAAEADAAKKQGYNKMKTAKAREELKEKGLEPLKDDELMQVSKMFNERLTALIKVPGSTYQNVFSLFRKADDDASGRVLYDELSTVVREQLTISEADLSEVKLTQLWCALDKDDSNSVEVGEFGGFMHLGGGRVETGAQHDKRVSDKLQKIKDKEASEEAALAKRIDANTMKTAMLRKELEAKKATPMNEAEIKTLSKLFNKRLQDLVDVPGSHFQGWFSLFQQADDDASGRIMFDELLDVMRVELKMSESEVPVLEAQRLWCALDKNNSNTVESDEFGKFMLLGAPERAAKGSQQSTRHAEQRQAIKAQEAKEEAAAAKKAGYNGMHTSELREELAQKQVAPLTDDALKVLAAKFNETLAQLTVGLKSRTWLQLFEQMDDDKSGLITYAELIDLVRDELHQTKTELPDLEVKQLWCALDKDNSNFVSQAEFGQFMNLSVQRTLAGTSQRRAENLRQAKKAKVAAQESEALKINGMNVMSTAQILIQLEKLGVPQMDEEQQKELSVTFNKRLEYMLPGKERARSWLTLFKEVDVDGSGLITYDELSTVVREKLKISKGNLSEVDVKALWCSLDTNKMGQIDQAEVRDPSDIGFPHHGPGCLAD